jgi:hypothetical protein
VRELGFSKEWDKLKKPVHTTFRLPRKDSDKGRDWKVDEVVKEVYKPRSPQRKVLQAARIIGKEPKWIKDISESEAIEDGFANAFEMWQFLKRPHMLLTINKLTLEVLKESDAKV